MTIIKNNLFGYIALTSQSFIPPNVTYKQFLDTSATEPYK